MGGNAGRAASRAIGEGGGGIDRTVLHIGRPEFPRVLMQTLRQIAGVDHCMVFAFPDDSNARCLLTAGSIGTGPDLGDAYAGHFHRADPNKDSILARSDSVDPIVLPSFERRMYRRDYLKLFFEDAGIVDKFASAVWHEGACFYANFYRLRHSGPFSAAQAARLNRVGPSFAAAIARHFEQESAARRPAGIGDVLQALFDGAPHLAALTSREREVCIRILLGLSSEAIAAHLDISLHSVLTYRRRAYERLGISSQNELFAIVVRLLAAGARGPTIN